MTTTVLNTKTSEVENQKPDTSSLVTTTILNTIISFEKLRSWEKSPDHVRYITTQEVNKLTVENFENCRKLKQANLEEQNWFW